MANHSRRDGDRRDRGAAVAIAPAGPAWAIAFVAKRTRRRQAGRRLFADTDRELCGVQRAKQSCASSLERWWWTAHLAMPPACLDGG